MAKNSGSEDNYFEALDFVINVLKKHEQILDKSIQELATLTEYLENTNALNSKVENAEEKINIIQKEVTKIVDGRSIMPKETLQTSVKEMGPQGWASPAIPSVVVQNGPSLVLHCTQWADFEVLAMHAQALSFSYKEDDEVLQVCAIKENQIIRYTGVLPDLSIILKTWLSKQLNIIESNIVEGFLDNSTK
jgi:hypothetical protein